MAKYKVAWAGIDRGHEGQWDPHVWIVPLKALHAHGQVDYNDLHHQFYQCVKSDAPEIGWVSTDKKTGEVRSLFRDNRETWLGTEVIDFNGTTMKLSAIGKKVVCGELAYSQVLAVALSKWEEHGEKPFAILANAFVAMGPYRGATLSDIVAIMQNYRDGDNLDDAIAASIDPLPSTSERRLRAILLLMEYAGGIIHIKDRFYASQRSVLESIAAFQRSDEVAMTADPLPAALRLFKVRRYEPAWQGKVMRESFLNVFEFAKMTAEEIAAMPIGTFKSAVMDKVWAFQNGGARSWGQLDDGEKAAYRKFVAEMRGGLKPFGAYFPTTRMCPRGMGVGVASELLMRFHPESCCSYNDTLIWDGLVALGLAGSGAVGVRALPGCGMGRVGRSTADNSREFAWPKTPAVYQAFMGVCAQVQQLMSEMGFGRTPAKDDRDGPDYITVNEFLWWAHENKDSIKEEVMKTEFKKVEGKPKKDGAKKLSDMMQDGLLKRLAAALRTKPFAILAGHSGTGKSQMVRRLAYMTCADEGLMAEAATRNAPGNYCMIQVKPNWHDSTDLLGYYSEMGSKYRSTEFVRFVMKAYAYPEIPFFVCLDEMNLAPVEHYFAEYLSALESMSVRDGKALTDPLIPKGYDADEVADTPWCRFVESKAWYEKYGLTIPRNLFVVGTVNMDDTTNQFSRKVLDRAMTILMDKVQFADMMDKAKCEEPGPDDLLQYEDVAQFLGGRLRADPLTTHQVALLQAVDGVLGKTPFAVAYRFANEYALYEASLASLTGKTDDEALAKEAMDHCVLMKVLPRIHGERKTLEELFRGNPSAGVKGLEDTLDKSATLSGRKMEEILGRKASYLSFWP